MSYRIATDNDPENPNPHAFDLGAETFETEQEAWDVIRAEELVDRGDDDEPWGSSIVLREYERSD